MPTAEDFSKWMKEFHPGIVFVKFQERVVNAYFNENPSVVPNTGRLQGKTFLREKITEFEQYWRQKKYAENI